MIQIPIDVDAATSGYASAYLVITVAAIWSINIAIIAIIFIVLPLIPFFILLLISFPADCNVNFFPLWLSCLSAAFLLIV